MNLFWVKKITLIDGIILIGLLLMVFGLSLKLKEMNDFEDKNRLVKVEKLEKAVEGIVNINSATLIELETLPGIGPKMAQRIIDYRNKYGIFSNKEAIKNVSGIGKKTYDKMADKIGI